jgi:heat-inducible transcriptional repressor
MSTPDLSRRARKILQAVVAEYLHSGDAVGSRTVTRRHEIGLSPATVRNVMADLEELGMLEQRHTSAGRVPTEQGLRFFIQSLLKVRGLSPKEKDDIRARVIGGSPDDVVQNASRLSVGADPARRDHRRARSQVARMSHIEFVPIRAGKLLAVLVGTDGRVENRVVTLAEPIDAARLERIHNYLSTLLAGLTLDEARAKVAGELGAAKHAYDGEVAAALRLGTSILASDGARPADLVVSGQANLVDPRSADPDHLDRMRHLLRTLEDKEALLSLLDRTRTAEGIQVFLGAETAHAALSDSSVVAVSYGCKTAANACAGQNGCKGQGFVDMTEEECKAKGGSVVAGM